MKTPAVSQARGGPRRATRRSQVKASQPVEGVGIRGDLVLLLEVDDVLLLEAHSHARGEELLVVRVCQRAERRHPPLCFRLPTRSIPGYYETCSERLRVCACDHPHAHTLSYIGECDQEQGVGDQVVF